MTNCVYKLKQMIKYLLYLLTYVIKSCSEYIILDKYKGTYLPN